LKFFIFFITLTILSTSLLSEDLKKNEKKTEEKKIIIVSSARNIVNNILKSSVNGLDYVFSLGEKKKNQNSSYIDFKVGPFYEKDIGKDYEWDVTANIVLPNTQKKLKLFVKNLESDDKDNSNGKIDKVDKKEKENSLLFGLQFAKNLFKNLYSGISTGVRFNEYTPDPFLSLSINYSEKYWSNWKVNTGNLFYYFLRYKTDNKLYFYLSYIFNSKTKIMSYNYYRYRQYFKLHEVKNGIGVYHIISKNIGINYELEVLRVQNSLFAYNISNKYAGLTLKHIFHSDWLYYEIKPGFYFRESNNFNFSPRIMFNLGIIFRTK